MGADQPGPKLGKKLIFCSHSRWTRFLFSSLTFYAVTTLQSQSNSRATSVMKSAAEALRAGSILSACHCALTPTLCPVGLTVFQSSGHSSRNQKLPVWALATPCYRLIGFSASLKGLYGAENVINKGRRGGEDSEGCFRWRKKWGREGGRRQGRGNGPFI